MAIKSQSPDMVERHSGAFSPAYAAGFAVPVVLFGVAVVNAPATTLAITGVAGAAIALTVASGGSEGSPYLDDNNEGYYPGMHAEVIEHEYNARPWDEPGVA